MKFPVILVGLFVLVLSGCASTAPYEPPASRNVLYAPDTPEGLRENILTYIEANYVDEIVIDIKTLSARTDLSIEEIIAKLNLDSRTSYISSDRFNNIGEISPTGEYASIGIEIEHKDKRMKVEEPYSGYPAALAGILNGDYITAINGEPISELKFDQIVSKLKGQIDTDVTVTVITKDQLPREVTMSRQLIKNDIVSYRNIDGVGYIKIRMLEEKTADDVKAALLDLKTSTSTTINGLILDLRSNKGGLLDQSIQVANLFIAGGKVFTTKGRAANDIEQYNARKKIYFSKKPIIVLVGNRTASGAEILAAALRQRGYALLLGAKTYGVGTVQTVVPLRNGRDGALRVTTHRIYTPNGEALDGNGLVPDIILDYAPKLADDEQKDTQLLEAIKILNSNRYQELMNANRQTN